MQAWIPVISSSLYFWKRVFSFRADSVLKSDGDFISNWKFPDCVHFFGAWETSRDWDNSRCVRTHELRRNCSLIGHNNTKHFLCPIRSRHPLEFLKIARWESVPRGSFARTCKLSSRLFSPPDWLSLGLRGWMGPKLSVWCVIGSKIAAWCMTGYSSVMCDSLFS